MKVQRIGLVGCVKRKIGTPAPARDLYISDLFAGRRAYVERTCGQWFILSALHGLLDPDTVVDPYDRSLRRASEAVREAWSQRVLSQVDERLGSLAGTVVEAHAGATYLEHGLIDGLARRGARVERPAAGLSLGEQLRFYKRAGAGQEPAAGGDAARPGQREAADSTGAAGSARTGPPSPGSKYRPLFALLSRSPDAVLRLTFSQIEAVLGAPLPPSAYRHPAWWANEGAGANAHARAWRASGFETSGVDLRRRYVTFRRRSD